MSDYSFGNFISAQRERCGLSQYLHEPVRFRGICFGKRSGGSIHGNVCGK